MIGPLVGFALAFLLVSWSLSLAAGATCAGRSRRPRDPARERTLAATAIVAPPLVACVVTGVVLVDSLVAMGGGDHCLPHAHHLHLCAAHGAAWAGRAGAVALVAAASALVAARLVRIGLAHVRAARHLRVLEAAARPAADGVRLIDSPRVFLFAAGVRRQRIYLSSAAWDALDADGRAAAMAHERAHLAAGDLTWRAVLSVAAAFGAPFTARWALAAWDRATERLRDQDAAGEVGTIAVAGALVELARRNALAPPWPSAALAPERELVVRVEALLAGGPADRRGARRLARAATVALVALSIVAIATVDPLHHALETILGVF